MRSSHASTRPWSKAMPKSVRVPDDLYEQVQKLAAKEQRSISNMLAVLLKQALDGKNPKGA